MNHRLPRLVLLACLSLTLTAGASTAFGARWSQVEEIFQAKCVICHQGAGAPLGLRLDSHQGVLAGSARGAVVEAGDPEQSELIRRVAGKSLPRMPLTGPPWLGSEEIDTLRAWIAAGARPESPAPAAEQQGKEKPAVAQPQTSQADRQATPKGPLVWQDVAPIFLARCAKCHSPNGIMGAPPEGFVTTDRQSLLAAGERARVVPGNPAASEVVRRIRGLSLPRMPFDGPPWLDQRQIALVERWIAEGARDDSGRPAPVPVGARVRFEGNLYSRWQVDDLPLLVTDDTRIRKNPRPGDRVEVRGVIQNDGRILATRIRPR